MQKSLSLQSEQTVLKYEIRRLTSLKAQYEELLAAHSKTNACVLKAPVRTNPLTLVPVGVDNFSCSGHQTDTPDPVPALESIPFTSYVSSNSAPEISKPTNCSKSVTMVTDGEGADGACSVQAGLSSGKPPAACTTSLQAQASSWNPPADCETYKLDPTLSALNATMANHTYLALDKYRELGSRLTTPGGSGVKPSQALTTPLPLFCDTTTNVHHADTGMKTGVVHTGPACAVQAQNSLLNVTGSNKKVSQQNLLSEHGPMSPSQNDQRTLSTVIETSNACSEVNAEGVVKHAGEPQSSQPVSTRHYSNTCKLQSSRPVGTRHYSNTDESHSAQRLGTRLCTPNAPFANGSPRQFSRRSKLLHAPSTILEACHEQPLGHDPSLLVTTIRGNKINRADSEQDMIEYSTTHSIAVSALLALNRQEEHNNDGR